MSLGPTDSTQFTQEDSQLKALKGWCRWNNVSNACGVCGLIGASEVFQFSALAFKFISLQLWRYDTSCDQPYVFSEREYSGRAAYHQVRRSSWPFPSRPSACTRGRFPDEESMSSTGGPLSTMVNYQHQHRARLRSLPLSSRSGMQYKLLLGLQ